MPEDIMEGIRKKMFKRYNTLMKKREYTKKRDFANEVLIPTIKKQEAAGYPVATAFWLEVIEDWCSE